MNAKSSSITIATSVVLVVGFAVLLEARSRQEIERPESNHLSGPPTRVLVNTKADAPVELQIAHPERAGADQNEPEAEIVITNTSNKVVSAYAIRYDVGLNGQLRPAGVELTQVSAARSLLRPGDSQTTSIGGVHYSLPIERLVVSVDFLEFTDGTTWGADTYLSKDMLAGMRAGRAASAKHLLQLLSSRGPINFSKELERAENDISIPVDHSPKWREGFQRGMAFVKERVRHEVKDSSATEIERVLTLPIDALDEIKRSTR